MIGVITGDIINSSKASSPLEYLTILKEEFNKIGPEPKYWEISKGDSFQLMTDPVLVIEKAILIKSRIKTIKDLDVKMALGIGEVSYIADRISESNGEAFVNSGRLFENSKQNLVVKSPWPEFDQNMNLMLKLALLFMNNWSQKSAEIIQLSLNNRELTQTELGEKIGLKQNLLSKLRKTAKYNEVLEIIKYYRNKLSHAINN